MPHCPKALYNNVIWANWDLLTRVYLIGNSLSSYCARWECELLSSGCRAPVSISNLDSIECARKNWRELYLVSLPVSRCVAKKYLCSSTSNRQPSMICRFTLSEQLPPVYAQVCLTVLIQSCCNLASACELCCSMLEWEC